MKYFGDDYKTFWYEIHNSTIQQYLMSNKRCEEMYAYKRQMYPLWFKGKFGFETREILFKARCALMQVELNKGS